MENKGIDKKMSLEELLSENARLNDKRRTCFKELRNKVKNELLPALCRALKDSDKNKTYIKFENKPFDGVDSYSTEWGKEYCIFIWADGEIVEGYQGYDNYGKVIYRQCAGVNQLDIDNLLSDAVVEMSVCIKEKIEKLNKRIALQIEKAEAQLLK